MACARRPVVMLLGTGLALAAGSARAQGGSFFPDSPDDEAFLTAPPPPVPPAAVPQAPEPPAPAFGAPGELVVTGSSSVGISSTANDTTNASSFSVYFSPGLDYFFVRNVSVGVDANLAYSDGKGYGADSSFVETTTSTVSAGPRVGVNIPIATWLSFYPRITGGIESVHRREHLVSGQTLSVAGSAVGAQSSTQTGPWINLFTPLLVHPRPHIFLGAGPSFFHDFGQAQGGGPGVGGERTTLGGNLVVGGWWGGAAPASLPEETTQPSRTRRFGEANEIVITGETSANAATTTYEGTGSSATSIGFTPGLDLFVIDHVSVGVGLSLSYSRIVGVDATTGAQVTYGVTGAGVSPRLGADLPLASWLSWYPRASFFVGYDSYDEASGAAENKYSDTRIAVGLYAPLLVHPAPHFFAGFGPTVSHDLSRSIDTAGYRPYLLTTVGAGLIVGGWL